MGKNKETEKNPNSEPIQNGFNVALKNLVDEIETIRKIKMITDSEYDSIQQLNDKLNKKEKEIDNLNSEIKELKKDKREKDDLNNQINSLKEDNERNKERLSLYIWVTIWSILALFSFCVIWLFIEILWIEDTYRLIVLLTGGLFGLSIMAVLIIVLADKAKKALTIKAEH